MPRPKHPFTETVRLIIAAEPNWPPERIRERLEDELRALKPEADDKGLPSLSTIERVKRGFRAEERAPYLLCHWPQVFEAGLLPWEAAAAFFELWRLLDGRRPLIPLVRWFWRINQAAADAPANERYLLAATMAVWERGGPGDGIQPIFPHEVEGYLVSAPWRSAPDPETLGRLRRVLYVPVSSGAAASWSVQLILGSFYRPFLTRDAATQEIRRVLDPLAEEARAWATESLRLVFERMAEAAGETDREQQEGEQP